MRKNGIISIISLLLVLVLAAGCSRDEAKAPNIEHNYEPVTDPDQVISGVNPITEVSGPDEMDQIVGIPLSAPEGATDVRYYVLDGRVADCTFLLDGNETVVRATMASGLVGNITGSYSDLATKETFSWNGVDVTLQYNEGEEGTAVWYFEPLYLSFGIYQKSGATNQTLSDLSAFYIDMFAAYVNRNPIYDQPAD